MSDNELYFLVFMMFCITVIIVTIVVFDYLDTCIRAKRCDKSEAE